MAGTLGTDSLIGFVTKRNSQYGPASKVRITREHCIVSSLRKQQSETLSPNAPATAAIVNALLMISCLLAAGCRSRPSVPPHIGSNTVDVTAVAGKLRAMMSPDFPPALHSPTSAHERLNAQKAYEMMQYMPAWVLEGRATPQALVIISALENSREKGLNAEDYEASHWPARLVALKAAPGNADTVAQFDAALTFDAIRYLSNLRIGRVNPKPLDFGVDLDQRHYDLPQFLVQKVLSGSNLPDVLNKVEPQYLGYRRT